MKNIFAQVLNFFSFFAIISLLIYCSPKSGGNDDYYTISKNSLQNKIKGAWAAQTIGVTYGGPTEFRYNKRIIPDSIEIHWSDTMMYHWMKNIPGLYDDIYMDLTFVEVMEKEGVVGPSDGVKPREVLVRNYESKT